MGKNFQNFQDFQKRWHWPPTGHRGTFYSTRRYKCSLHTHSIATSHGWVLCRGMEDRLGNKSECVERHLTLQTVFIWLLGAKFWGEFWGFDPDPTGVPPLDSAGDFHPPDALCAHPDFTAWQRHCCTLNLSLHHTHTHTHRAGFSLTRLLIRLGWVP